MVEAILTVGVVEYPLPPVDSTMDEMPHNIPFKEIEIEEYKHGPHINLKIAI